jgi:hypothetical protein
LNRSAHTQRDVAVTRLLGRPQHRRIAALGAPASRSSSVVLSAAAIFGPCADWGGITCAASAISATRSPGRAACSLRDDGPMNLAATPRVSEAKMMRQRVRPPLRKSTTSAQPVLPATRTSIRPEQGGPRPVRRGTSVKGHPCGALPWNIVVRDGASQRNQRLLPVASCADKYRPPRCGELRPSAAIAISP